MGLTLSYTTFSMFSIFVGYQQPLFGGNGLMFCDLLMKV